MMQKNTRRGNTQSCVSKGFTLIELLVVVLIIGILAAVALPQYQKAVLKANLHKGIALVESLYNAQQAYLLTNGTFATDIDELDVAVPINENCSKKQQTSSGISTYACNFGTIGLYDNFSNMQYLPPQKTIAYLRYLKDFESGGLLRQAGETWCFAKTANTTAQEICKNMGGEFGNSDNTWTRYKIR